MKLCVYGSLSEPKQSGWSAQAAQLGRELAHRGHTLVFGGGGTGLLGALAQAALEAAGSLLAVVRTDSTWETPLPGTYHKVPAHGYRWRKQRMEELADAFLILPGGIGTLDECVETLILESRWKPVVLWNLDGYYNGLKDFFCRARAEGLLSQQWDFAPWFCETTEEIWTALERTE